MRPTDVRPDPMAVCSSCGNDNPAAALFCEKCGASLAPQQTPSAEGADSGPKKPPERMEEVGKKMGEAFGRIGKEIGQRAEQAGRGATTWWDQRLGIAGPIVSGLIGLVVLLIFVIIFEGIAAISAHERFWRDLADFILNNIWLFIVLIFLNAISEYLNRRYWRTWRWARPFALAIGFFGWFWIFAQVLEIVSTDLHSPTAGELGDFIELVLPLIFILVLVLAYLVLAFRVLAERQGVPPSWQKNRP